MGDGATVVGDGTTDGTTDDPLDTGDGARGGSGDPTRVARDVTAVPPPSPWVSLATSKALFPGSFCDLDLDLCSTASSDFVVGDDDRSPRFVGVG